MTQQRYHKRTFRKTGKTVGAGGRHIKDIRNHRKDLDKLNKLKKINKTYIIVPLRKKVFRRNQQDERQHFAKDRTARCVRQGGVVKGLLRGPGCCIPPIQGRRRKGRFEV